MSNIKLSILNHIINTNYTLLFNCIFLNRYSKTILQD